MAGNNMAKEKKEIGLAIIGCGTIGRIRGMFAKDYPGIGWIGPGGELLLQKRAAAKYHFGGLWTNACCGHPR